MPNWVYNTLTITGKPKALHKLIKQVNVTKEQETQYNEASVFSFAKVIPMPDDQKDNWYEWRIANWGTKWNANVEYNELHTWESGEVKIEFNTAWSPAEPIILTLSEQHPTLTFYWKFHEESNAFWGNYTIKNRKYLEFFEGEFKTCAEFNEFGISHHICNTCENWIHEWCDNSDTQEVDMCDECKENKEQELQEIQELEKELWGVDNETTEKENAV